MITEEMLSALRAEMAKRLPKDRYQHTLGVEKEMRALAKIYLPDKVEEAAAAGLLHDVTKPFSYKEQLEYADENGVFLDEDERDVPPVIHAKTGAHYVKTHFSQFATDAVVHAISVHTLADTDMSVFDMMLFLSDFTEENRKYEDCRALRHRLYTEIESRMADKEVFLYEMVADACDASVIELIENKRPIAVKTVRARNKVLSILRANTGKK